MMHSVAANEKIKDLSTAAKSIKHKRIENAVEEILDALGLDLSNDSLRETPTRVAKMYLNEIFGGLNEDLSSVLKSFENSYGYKGIVIEKDIPFQSHCEHHLLPILGRAAIAYIPEDRVLGLSKLNRILHHYARRPQVQERLTMQVADMLGETLKTDDVAVILEARHLCVEMRGVRDSGAETSTMVLRGRFEKELKDDFFRQLS